MILETNEIDENGMVGDQPQEVKSEEEHPEKTEHQTTSSVISHKFKLRKRKMGNLILKTSSFAGGEIDNGNVTGNGEEYEYSDRTLGGTLSGILSRFFHIKQPSSLGEDPDEIIKPEYSNMRQQDDLDDSRSTRRGFCRIFETYRRINYLKTQKPCEEYHDNNFEKEKNFNRFFKLEQALDASGDEKIPRSVNNESNSISKDLSVGGSLKDDLEEISEDRPKAKFDTQLLLSDSPKTESAVLENTVFSPNTHRPSLRDIPGIENIEISSPDQDVDKPYGTFRMALKMRSNKNILYGKSPKHQDPHFNNLDDEIDSHLYYHSRRNVLFKCFPSKTLVYQDNMRETHNENTDFAPDLESDKQIPDEQIPTIPTTPNSLSDSLTAIKGIFQQKYKSSFSRDKNKRRNLSVRFVSPILSPIEMTNNEENEDDNNNTQGTK
ncbi:unnamed protein product [Debaryomyces fabryi]|nr:unnamed protein product [Debaryomyces fabryi]